MPVETLIVALWVALSVFVVWVAVAKTFLRRREQAATAEEPEGAEFLEAQSAGLESAWETLRESPNQS